MKVGGQYPIRRGFFLSSLSWKIARHTCLSYVHVPRRKYLFFFGNESTVGDIRLYSRVSTACSSSFSGGTCPTTCVFLRLLDKSDAILAKFSAKTWKTFVIHRICNLVIFLGLSAADCVCCVTSDLKLTRLVDLV